MSFKILLVHFLLIVNRKYLLINVNYIKIVFLLNWNMKVTPDTKK